MFQEFLNANFFQFISAECSKCCKRDVISYFNVTIFLIKHLHYTNFSFPVFIQSPDSLSGPRQFQCQQHTQMNARTIIKKFFLWPLAFINPVYAMSATLLIICCDRMLFSTIFISYLAFKTFMVDSFYSVKAVQFFYFVFFYELWVGAWVDINFRQIGHFY